MSKTTFSEQLTNLRMAVIEDITTKVKAKKSKQFVLADLFTDLFTVWNAGFDEIEECEVLQLKIDSKTQELMVKIRFLESNNEQYTPIEFIDIKELVIIADKIL